MMTAASPNKKKQQSNDPSVVRLSKLVTELRKDFKSMEEIGRRLGMTGTNAQKWEDREIDGIGDLKVRNLRNLATLKNWTLDELIHYLEGTSPPPVEQEVLLAPQLSLEDVASLPLEEKLRLNLELAKSLIQESRELEKINLSGQERRKLAWLLELSMRVDKKLIAAVASVTGLKRIKIEALLNSSEDLEVTMADLDALAPCCYSPVGWDSFRPTDLSGRRLTNGRELLAAIKNGNGAVK